MAKLTRERLSQDIALLHTFRSYLEEFHSKRVKLKQLQDDVEQYLIGHNAAEAMKNDLMTKLMASRREVGRRIPDVMEITSRYPLPTVLKIMPPPLLGGYVSTGNVFQAFIELRLPYDFELDPIRVFDIVDQAV